VLSFGLGVVTNVDVAAPYAEVDNFFMMSCQGRIKRKPLGRSKREPVRWTVRRGFSGEKGLWSVAEEALLPRSALGGGRFSVLRMGFVCGGFA
jgi:hypothetical protein